MKVCKLHELGLAITRPGPESVIIGRTAQVLFKINFVAVWSGRGLCDSPVGFIRSRRHVRDCRRGHRGCTDALLAAASRFVEHAAGTDGATAVARGRACIAS